MAISLADFHTIISEEIDQGDRLDSAIPRYVRRAARFMERNWSLIYMERFTEIDIDVSSADPRFITWPTPLIKTFDFLRYPCDDEYVFLTPVEPINVVAIQSGPPQHYWLTGSEDGNGYLVLDQVGSDDLTLECKTTRYTDWPTSLSATPWLCTHGEGALVAATLIQMAGYAGMPEWLQQYNDILQLEIKSLIDADTELRNAGHTGGFQMIFS